MSVGIERNAHPMAHLEDPSPSTSPCLWGPNKYLTGLPHRGMFHLGGVDETASIDKTVPAES